ncbi:MAG: cell division protein FtsA [Pseudomonadota bacterium]
MAILPFRPLSNPDNIIAAIDIGASKTVCVIAKRVASGGHDTEEIDVVGFGQVGVSARETRADAKRAAAGAVAAAVEAAERMAKIRLRRAVVSINGKRLRSKRVGVDLNLAGAAVSTEDVVDCLHAGANFARRSGDEIIHTLPIGFTLDGENVGANPCGLIGEKLTAQVVCLSVSEGQAANLRNVLEAHDITIDRLVAGPYAAASAVLSEDEKELGVLMIDIGARTSGFAVFEGGALIKAGGVGVGGEHVTRDLAHVFGCSVAHAERVKALHGSMLSSDMDEHRLIDFPQLNEAGENLSVSRGEVTSVITPRIEELFSLVLREAISDQSAGSGAAAGLRRVVLTGGGSQLGGMCEAAERIFSMRARIGRPHGLRHAPEVSAAPGFSACIGALVSTYQKRLDEPREQGDFRIVNEANGTSGFMSGVAHWLKVNF